MGDGDHYRRLAASCERRAAAEEDQLVRVEWEVLADTYRRLAVHEDSAARQAPPVK